MDEKRIICSLMFPGATSKIEAVFFDQGPGMIMDDSFLFSANVVGQHIL